MKDFLKKYFPLIVIGVVYIWSAVAISLYRADETPPGMVVLKMGHWQLEAGVRDGFNAMIKEYEQLHPNVKIIQQAVPEGVYGQWLSTQLIGGTAPDILQMGMLPEQQILAYYNRYCMPITNLVNKPNPYNKGTDLESVPLRQTFVDGMKSCYIQEIQEYMAVSLSQHTTRVFYNKDLLKKLTGSDEPPKNYRQFYNICQEIKKHKNDKGQYYIPVVGSQYHFQMWIGPMCDILTYQLMDKADFNRDGFVGNDELYVAVKSGKLSFSDSAIEARFQMVSELASFCQPGFTGLGRDEGLFLFAQNRAVFMTTGTWDALSLIEQTKSSFKLGVMDYPLPDKDDPVYGDVIKGPRYENPGPGFQFSVIRNSKHPDIAIDFLLFIASKQRNGELNKIIGWIPVIKGAEQSDLFKDFAPCLNGVYGNLNPNLGGETWLRWMQLGALFNVNQISFENLVRDFEPYYKESGAKDFREQQKDWQRVIGKNERFLSTVRGEAIAARKSESEDRLWAQYRYQTMRRQLFPEIKRAVQMNMIETAGEKNAPGPYEYSPEVLDKIKARLNAEVGAKGVKN